MATKNKFKKKAYNRQSAFNFATISNTRNNNKTKCKKKNQKNITPQPKQNNKKKAKMKTTLNNIEQKAKNIIKKHKKT